MQRRPNIFFLDSPCLLPNDDLLFFPYCLFQWFFDYCGAPFQVIYKNFKNKVYMYFVQSLCQVVGGAVLVSFRVEDQLRRHGVWDGRRHLQQFLANQGGRFIFRTNGRQRLFLFRPMGSWVALSTLRHYSDLKCQHFNVLSVQWIGSSVATLNLLR